MHTVFAANFLLCIKSINLPGVPLIQLPTNQKLADLTGTVATIWDVGALSLSTLGSFHVAYETIAGSSAGPEGTLGGYALSSLEYQTIVNPAENAVSSFGSLFTVVSDFASGASSLKADTSGVRLRIGSSTAFSAVGLVLGNTPLLGTSPFADTDVREIL